MPRILDNSQRYRYAVLFHWIVAGASVLSMASEASQYFLLKQLAAGVTVPAGAADASDWRQRVVGSTQLVLMLLAFVALVLWAYRAYENLHRLRQFPRPRHDQGAAGWSWFVPILNLWYPYQAMKDIWYLTQRYEQPKGGAGYERDHGLIGGWWVLRLFTYFAGRAISAPRFNATIDQIQDSVLALMGMDALHVWFALTTAYLLKKLRVFEQGLADRCAPNESGAWSEQHPVAPVPA